MSKIDSICVLPTLMTTLIDGKDNIEDEYIGFKWIYVTLTYKSISDSDDKFRPLSADEEWNHAIRSIFSC